MQTSLKTGFAQIFSYCPKNLSSQNLGGAAPLAPPPPPARTPMPSLGFRYNYFEKDCRINARDNPEMHRGWS